MKTQTLNGHAALHVMPPMVRRMDVEAGKRGGQRLARGGPAKQGREGATVAVPGQTRPPVSDRLKLIETSVNLDRPEGVLARKTRPGKLKPPAPVPASKPTAPAAPKADKRSKPSTPPLRKEAPVAPQRTKVAAGKGQSASGKGGSSTPVGKAERVPADRAATKKELVLALLRRPNGASLPELIQATGWQSHSVRGFLSGAITKKMGLKVRSAKDVDGLRRYSVRS